MWKQLRASSVSEEGQGTAAKAASVDLTQKKKTNASPAAKERPVETKLQRATRLTGYATTMNTTVLSMLQID